MTDLDFAATFGIGIAIILAVAIFVFGVLRQDVRPVHLCGAIIALICYGVSIIWLPELISWPGWVNDLKWNWTGKLVSIVVSLGLILIWPRLGTTDVGLTFVQRQGSLGPAAVMAAILCASAILLQSVVSNGTDTRLETVLFEASMPGLDEELAFRGLIGALLVRAFVKQVSVLGAPMGWGDLALCLVFGAGHGLLFMQQQLHFDWMSFAYTGGVGAGLLWIRQRTGSLLLPVLTHNVVNILLVCL
jgi:uncharacterized protein